MELHKRKDYKQLRFGSPVAAMKAAQRFKESLGYKIVEPVNANITSPGKKNTLSCYGLFYNRPEFRDKDWLYLLIELSEWKSVFSRKHYYSVNGDDWYITGYTTSTSLEEPYSEFHPYGHNVGLTRWDSEYPLDTDRWQHPVENGTYPRLPITLVSLYTGESVT